MATFESAQAIRDCADYQVIGLTRRHVFFGISIGESTMKLIVNAIGMLVGLFVLGISNAQQLERWEVVERMVLLDTFTDLEWTRRDNLKDINWHDAKTYCDTLDMEGGDWRLPTADELAYLLDEGRYGNTHCGTINDRSVTCIMSPKFHLTGPVAWSSEQKNGSSSALSVVLKSNYDGDRRLAGPFSLTNYRRAICVRQGS
jgi:hypothetical protein